MVYTCKSLRFNILSLIPCIYGAYVNKSKVLIDCRALAGNIHRSLAGEQEYELKSIGELLLGTDRF